MNHLTGSLKRQKKTDQQFFNDNDQSDVTKSALDFCIKYHGDQINTQNFTKLLNEHNLLIDKKLTTTVKSKDMPLSLTGFKIIDEEKLKNLDEKLIVEWHRSGILSLIYMHLISLSNFDHLIKLIK